MKKSAAGTIKTDKGLTLTEILIAITVIVIAILPAMWVFISGTTGIHVTRNYHTAVLFAREATEACRAYSYTWLDSEDLYVDGNSSNGLDEPFKSINQKDSSIDEGVMKTRFLEHAFSMDNGDDDRFWNTKEIRDVVFNRTVNIFNVASAEADVKPECKIIEVIMTWNEPSTGEERSFKMTTALARTKM